MFREQGNPPVEEVNVFLNSGGLGDHIAALPVVKYAASRNAKIILWVPEYFFEFATKILPEIKVYSFKDIEKRNKYADTCQTISATHTPMRMGLVDFAATMIADKQLETHEKNYLRFPVESVDVSKFSLPEKFVVLTTGYTAQVREMKPEVVNGISDYLVSKGITPVYLGSNQTLNVIKSDKMTVQYKGEFSKDVDYTKGIDLINKTSLPEAAAIMQKSIAVVGLDNGLLHLAGCTDAKIIAGFTTVEPKYRLPIRNNMVGYNCYPVVPDETLGCRFCQSNWSFVYDHDFKRCWFKETGKDNKIQCVEELTADKYIAQLEKLI